MSQLVDQESSAQITVAVETVTLPLVAAQPGIWMAEQLAAEKGVFNVAHYTELCHTPDRSLFDNAIRRGLADTGMVNTRFSENAAGEPQQTLCHRLMPEDIAAPEWFDFSAEADGEAQALAWMRVECCQPVMLSDTRPLYRQAIICVERGTQTRWFWYQRFHHLLLDGFSFTRLTTHILAIYQALRQGIALPVSPFTAFASVVAEYLSLQNSEQWRESGRFWRQHAASLPMPVSLAVPEQRVVADTALPRQQHCPLQTVDIIGASQKTAIADSELLMAGVCLYLARMSGESRLSVGMPFMRRMGSVALTALGPVVNVLPLQVTASDAHSLADVARAWRQELKTVKRHQWYEAEQLRRDLGLVGSEKALYGPVINYKIFQQEGMIDGQPTITHPLSMGPIDDLEVEIAHHDDQLTLTLFANPTRYSMAELTAHGERLQQFLQRLFAEPEKASGQFSLLSAREAKNISRWSSGGELADDPALISIIDVLCQRAAETPDEMAIVDVSAPLTWRLLHQRTMQLARELISHDIGAEDVVALALPRSPESIVAIFAVLASGAAYLPLDMDYPTERLALMCEDAQPALIITTQQLRRALPEGWRYCELDKPETVHRLALHDTDRLTDAQRRQPLQAEHLAYIIYTSGSTGKPKGVMSTHRGLLNLYLSHRERLFGPAIVTLQKTHQRRMRAGHTASFSFDSSWEPLFCMLMGAELVIFDEEMRRDAWAVVQSMHHTAVDIMDVTPSFLLQMIDSGLLAAGQPAPHLIMIGGEAATPHLWQLMRDNPQISFCNYYGPSEYTIDTLGTEVSESAQPVIGRPVANTQVWLLNEKLQPVPPGVAGELYISGAGIARGYLHRPDLTASRFVANPFRHGEVMYRTGDVMRWREDGKLIFIGRVDHQIKIRGFRVELGEIESALSALPSVSSAVVIAQPCGISWRVIGYCAIADAQRRAQHNLHLELQQTLAEQLPDYMVPALLVILEALPLTVNGKVDRQALPEPQFAVETNGPQAQTDAEQALCQAMARVLGLRHVTLRDDFFALGGDSISAMSLGNQLRRDGWQLRPKDIFTGRTPQAMVRVMTTLSRTSLPATCHYGTADSLPMVHWYGEQGRHAFIHGIWLQAPQTLDLSELTLMMAQLTRIYPVLGARLSDNSLSITPAEYATDQCEVYHCRGDAKQAAEAAFHHAIEKIDPEQAIMWQARLLQENHQCVGVILVVHHLVIDGVSWRQLVDTFPLAARAVRDNHQLALPTSPSLPDWNQWLVAHKSHYRAELPFWQSMLSPVGSGPFSAVLDPKQDTYRTRSEYHTTLSPAQSAALLGPVPEAWRTRTDVLLLTALLLAYRSLTGEPALSVSVESHGRPDKLKDMDLSGCIGWLTAEYPLRFCADHHSGQLLPDAVRAVKRVTEGVKDAGIGFGILRYLFEDAPLAPLPDSAPVPILFNYLGRLGQSDAGDWRMHREAGIFSDGLAVYTSPDMPLSHLLDINIFAGEGESAALSLHWGFARRWINHATVIALADGFVDALNQLITFASHYPQQAADSLVAAQTGIAQLTEQDVSQLRTVHGALDDILPLLPLQQGLLFHISTDEQNGSYNSLTRLTLQGEVSAEKMARVLNQLVVRYPQLAARFDSEHAVIPVQILLSPADCHESRLQWPLTLIEQGHDVELQSLLAECQSNELQRVLLAADRPLLHACWVRHAQGVQHTLFITAHHLVIDGWSTPYLVNDLIALLNHEQAELALPPMTYPALVRSLAARDPYPAQAAWQAQMAGVTPVRLFGEQRDTGAVATLSRTVSDVHYQTMTNYCRQHGVTLNTVMQGVWALVLALYSGHDDVVFGSPVSGRMHDTGDVEKQVGLFSNTLPVRVQLKMQQPLLPQLQQLQQQQMRLMEHDNIGLADIQRLAGVGTLFDTLLVVENYPDTSQIGRRDQTVWCEEITHCGYTHYPVTLLVLPGEQLRLHLEYRAVLEAPEGWMDRIELMLTQLLSDPHQPLCQWSLITQREQRILQGINHTVQSVPDETLYSAIQKQARVTPHALALQDEVHQLTWAAMHLQVTELAARLQQEGVAPGDVVAVALPRSVFLSLALQAIVAVGAAWLPLDVGYPDQRLHLMLEDAQPRLVIVDPQQNLRFQHYATCLCFDQLVEKPSHRVNLPDIDPTQPAYVLYTSGSTGRPKGVEVSHRAIINRLRWMQATFPLGGDDVVLQKTPSSFDVSVWEFFWPLISGAALYMAPPEAHRDPLALLALIQQHKVTTLHFVPSMLATLLDTLEHYPQQTVATESLRRVFCSGEALSVAVAQRFQQHLNAELHNLYGPTEAAVDVTWQPVTADITAQPRRYGVPLGRPVWNTQLHVIDRFLRLLPPGAPGELCLSGVQLACGYYHRPALTAGRFMASPFASGERMYRTGDMACWHETGGFEYLGRNDDQLKIRGQRIELGEIEQCLMALPGIAQAVVNACTLAGTQREGDNRQLVAWLIASDPQPPSSEAITIALTAHLPGYMIPVRYLFLSHYPLSPSGKLDRNALPVPQHQTVTGTLPEGESECAVAALFCEVLGVEMVNTEDDFFALGGHSLLAMQLTVALRRHFQRSVTLGQVMTTRTVRQLARVMTGDTPSFNALSAGSETVLPLRAGTGPTLFCFHPASGFAWQYNGLLRYLRPGYPIIGLQSPRPDGVIAASTDIDMACEQHLATLRGYQPAGPYYLLGYSLGGTLAHGVATRLTEQGEEVAFLGLLDTWPAEGQDWQGPGEEQARAEVAREQADFMDEETPQSDRQLRAEKQAMFNHIVANYQDAVRLLSGAKTSYYPREATLLMATETLPHEYDPQTVWRPYVGKLTIYPQCCEHADILAPETLKTLGPLLDRLIDAAGKP